MSRRRRLTKTAIRPLLVRLKSKSVSTTRALAKRNSKRLNFVKTVTPKFPAEKKSFTTENTDGITTKLTRPLRLSQMRLRQRMRIFI
jgi:hypothetical protein